MQSIFVGIFFNVRRITKSQNQLVHNATWDTVSDGDLIEFMKNAFNNRCHGSLELLSSETLHLSEHIHLGKKIQTFKENSNGNA